MNLRSTTIAVAALGVSILLLCGSAGGQTTQPATEAWPATVQRVAQALTEARPNDVRALLTTDVSVRTFDAEDDIGEITRLMAHARVTSLISAHAYLHPPLVMAADIAVDCKNAIDLPDSLRERMVPQDDLEIKRANATAVQWLSHVIGAADGDLIGVILFFAPSEPLTGTTTSERTLSGELLWVVLKGQPVNVATEGEEPVLIRQIVYGNPLVTSR